jgi:hypothetical protein
MTNIVVSFGEIPHGSTPRASNILVIAIDQVYEEKKIAMSKNELKKCPMISLS